METEQDIISKATKFFGTRETSRQEGNYSLFIFGSCFPGCFKPYTSPYHKNAELHCALFFASEHRGLTIFMWPDYISFTKEAYENFLTGKGTLVNMKAFEKTWRKVNEWYEAYPLHILESMSHEKITELLTEILKEYHNFFAETVFCESLDEAQIKHFYDKAGGKPEVFQEFLKISSKPTFDSFILKQDEILLATQDNNEIQRIFTNYWLTQTVEETSSKYQSYIKEKGGREKIETEAEDLKKELAISVNEVKEYRATLSDELQLLLDFTQVCMHLRDIRKEPLQKVITLMSNCGRAIFKKIGLDEEDAAYAYYEDFVSGSYARAEYKAEIAKRKDGVTVLFSNEEIIFEYGDVAEKKAQALDLFDKITTSNELRGSTAYPGKVRGIVRVLHNEDDFSRFNEGEILVTSMTRPEFVPLMKRAAAVITDEGGVTCHAAIIARELKLPCIIGTRQATRVLRDGDLVEMDAVRGIVKKI
jgi:phosphoenolpyruvate synthase/pyruvate phosphate dikinase